MAVLLLLLLVIMSCLLPLGSSQGNTLSFLSSPGFVRVVGYEGSYKLNIDIKIRTWHEDGLLLFHKFSSTGHLKIRISNGIIRVEMVPERSEVLMSQYDVIVNDGEWHRLHLLITRDEMRLRLDNTTSVQSLQQHIRTGPFYLVGGGLHGEVGFVGCVGWLSVDGERKVVREYEVSQTEEVLVGECRLTNLCSASLCHHGGSCRHLALPGPGPGVSCDCEQTGYSGAVCRTSQHWRSCQQYLQYSGSSEGQVKVDLDGSGPLEPATVTCTRENDNFLTSVSHSNPEPTKVDGFQAPGSFGQAILYSVPRPLLHLLISRAASCWQSLRYDCRQSGLLGRPDAWEPWGWWLSGRGERMEGWAGAGLGSRLCQCGERGDCLEAGARCNCDSDHPGWTSDSGLIRDKLSLPVTRLHFGDTGTPLDTKEGRFSLGPLVCSHPSPASRRGRVSLGRTGESDSDCPEIFLELRLVAASNLTGLTTIYNLQAGQQVCRLTVLGRTGLRYEWGSQSAIRNISINLQGEGEDSLADGRWHSVNIEHNPLEVSLVLDRNNVATSSHNIKMTESRQLSNSYYLMDVDDEATSKLEVRMFEVEGQELSHYEDLRPQEEDKRSGTGVAPVEAVHAKTNNTIRKLFPVPNLIILISVLCLIIMFILLVTLGVVRFVDRAKSETYYTQEEVEVVQSQSCSPH